MKVMESVRGASFHASGRPEGHFPSLMFEHRSSWVALGIFQEKNHALKTHSGFLIHVIIKNMALHAGFNKILHFWQACTSQNQA